MGVRFPALRSASMMREAVDVAGQHAVHDDDIVALAGGQEQAVAAVVGVVGRVARLAADPW